jgi:hypothetical protein
MGLFNKKKIKKEVKQNEVPSLPELPELPDFPEATSGEQENKVHKLPSYPSSSFGEKFSQNAIKEAVSGEEGDKEGWKADEFAREQEMQTMSQPLEKPEIKEYGKNLEEREIPSEFRQVARSTKKTEPLFIRIDKFEESLKTFDNIKTKVSEIDKMLGDIKKIREEEEEELKVWEEKIQSTKKQIEKIDKNLFSRIE